MRRLSIAFLLLASSAATHAAPPGALHSEPEAHAAIKALGINGRWKLGSGRAARAGFDDGHKPIDLHGLRYRATRTDAPGAIQVSLFRQHDGKLAAILERH